jgi:hypothetical protein
MLLLSAMIAMLSFPALAATRSFGFTCRTKVIRNGCVCYENRLHTYQFTIQVISDYQGTKAEIYRQRYPFIQAQPGERYSVMIQNPLPVRVAVNLMIDGLSSVTGDPCSPSTGTKWLLEPYSAHTISGWQVNSQELRRFYFTSKEESYARWRSYSMGQDLTVRCGTISAAFFWSRSEMEEYFERNPIWEGGYPYPYPCPPMAMERSRNSAAGCYEDRQDAGTGMGERGSNPVQTVDFRYDTGMYQERDAVVIYYDFDNPPYYIQPPVYRDERQGYAPEIPDRQ